MTQNITNEKIEEINLNWNFLMVFNVETKKCMCHILLLYRWR